MSWQNAVHRSDAVLTSAAHWPRRISAAVSRANIKLLTADRVMGHSGIRP
jgi:hypothetical protein